jgi:uncharacterized protein YggE
MRPVKSALAAMLMSASLALPALAADPGQITVTGEGQVEARPDMATVSLGVTTRAATAAEAMAANSVQLALVLEQLRASGIEERDVQTSGLSLSPDWQQPQGQATPEITGYVASNMLTVRVRALDGLGKVLDTAVSDGANTFNGLTFGLQDPEPSMNEARRRAVADAMGRAELLATSAGVKLGRIVSITEGGGMGGPVPMYRMQSDAAAAVPVAAGEVATGTSVTMVFELAE